MHYTIFIISLSLSIGPVIERNDLALVKDEGHGQETARVTGTEVEGHDRS